MMMTTSSSLSADAKEFVPHSTNPPPLTYIYVPPPPPPPPTSIVYLPNPVGFYPPPLIYPTQRISRKQKSPKQPVSNLIDPSFQYRLEDFPTLSVPNSIPTVQKVLPSWKTVVSRPQSKSPHSNRIVPPPVSSSLPSNCSTPQRSQSSVSVEQPTKKTLKKKKKKTPKVETKLTPKVETKLTPKVESLDLTDESAFPTLGQDVSTVEPTKSSMTTGLIAKSRLKAHQSFEIRLTDMFNALSTSTRSKVSNKKSSEPIGANPLDSNPAPKRGKEREQPRARKPTKLKRIINKELEANQKQQQNLTTDNTSVSSMTDDDDDDEDEDEDEDEDHQPTSQSQTPFAQEFPSSTIKQQIHDGTFREYCSQLIDRQLDELCIQLLLTLKRFQDRKRQQLANNPDRARRKRRFVHGIREVTKHLRAQRLKCVLIAPDCQSIQSEGGLNQAIEQIIEMCNEQNLPVIFTLNREKLGRCLNKISRISAIGIFDYSGADSIYKQILEIREENRRAYKQILDGEDSNGSAPSTGLNKREFFKVLHRTFQQQSQGRTTHIINTIPQDSMSKFVPKVAAHHGHSRQTSDTSMIYIDPQLINAIKKNQHTRASSGTFDLGMTKKHSHQRTLSDGATSIDFGIIPLKHHSRTPSGCSAISQIEQQDYFEQSKNVLLYNPSSDVETDLIPEESRLKSIHEDTEEISANSKRKNVEKWINEN